MSELLPVAVSGISITTGPFADDELSILLSVLLFSVLLAVAGKFPAWLRSENVERGGWQGRGTGGRNGRPQLGRVVIE